MRINYFSDLHLEFGGLLLPDTDADIVIAAGDIGIGLQGLDWLKMLKKPVVYVAGNHEFYSNDHQQTLNRLREESFGTHVYFLENQTATFQDVRFLGCTLWTDLFAEGPLKANAVSEILNDFRRIKVGSEPFDLQLFSRLHAESRAWLETELAKPFHGKTVVVTHHAPIKKGWIEPTVAHNPLSWLEKELAQSCFSDAIKHEAANTDWNWDDWDLSTDIKRLAYCNDLRSLFYGYDIDAWFYGHVHKPTDYHLAGTRILNNPRGYVGKKLVPDFDINRTVDI